MYDDWPKTTKTLSAQLRDLRGSAPEVMKAFADIAQTALAAKALDAKTKELIALAIGEWLGSGSPASRQVTVTG